MHSRVWRYLSGDLLQGTRVHWLGVRSQEGTDDKLSLVTELRQNYKGRRTPVAAVQHIGTLLCNTAYILCNTTYILCNTDVTVILACSAIRVKCCIMQLTCCAIRIEYRKIQAECSAIRVKCCVMQLACCAIQVQRCIMNLALIESSTTTLLLGTCGCLLCMWYSEHLVQ